MAEFDFAQNWHYFVIAAIVCYLIGCFNFAVLISRSKKKDIRNVGSGNPGTMNMTRTFGLKTGIINFFCDLIKGGVPALTGYLLFKGFVFKGTDILVSDFARYFFGVFVIIGHIFPVTLNFRGGKGMVFVDTRGNTFSAVCLYRLDRVGVYGLASRRVVAHNLASRAVRYKILGQTLERLGYFAVRNFAFDKYSDVGGAS